MSEMLKSPSLEDFARELLDSADGSDHSIEQGFVELLGAVPADGSPWGALPMALDDAALAMAAEEAAADLMSGTHPAAGDCASVDAAAAPAAPTDAAFDWLLPFIDAPAAHEASGSCSADQRQPTDAKAALEARRASVRERSRLWQQRSRARQRQKLKESTSQLEELTRELEALRCQQAESLRREKLFEKFVASQTPIQRAESGPQGSDNTTSSSEDSIRSSARVLPHDQVAAVRPATWEDLRSRLWTMPEVAQLAYRGKTSAEFWGHCQRYSGVLPCRFGGPQVRGQQAHVRFGGGGQGAEEDPAVPATQHASGALEQMAAQQGPPTAELWRSIAQTVKLSPEQRRRCTLLRTAAYARLGALMCRRAELAKSMTAVPDLQDAEVTGSLTIDFLGARPMSERMHNMLLEEHSMAAQLQGCLYGNILSTLQCCHCHVLAYPFEANPLALLDAFVASSGQLVAPPGQLLQQGAAAESEQQLPSLLKAAPPLTIEVAGSSPTIEGNVTW